MNSAASQRKRSTIPGLILIFIGLYFLARKFDWIDLGWIHIYPLIFLGIGIKAVFDYKKHPGTQPLFLAGSLLPVGVFFFLRNYEFIPFWTIDQVWPVLTLGVGTGFLLVYAVHSRDAANFLVSAVFIVFSSVALAVNFGLFDWWGMDRLWPLLLIALGFFLIRNSLKQKSAEKPS